MAPPTSSPAQDSHELQSFLRDGSDASAGDAPQRHGTSAIDGQENLQSKKRRGTAFADDDDVDKESSDYDEDFADETFRLRTGRPSASLDLLPGAAAALRREARGDVDDEEGDDDEESVRVKRQPTDDPMVIISRAVPETDDPTLPAFTIRVALIGSFFAIIGAGISQLFFYKSNSPSFSSYFVILISLPIGRWMARTFPRQSMHIPFTRISFDLNPGPFNMKEHLLIAVLSSCAAVSAYAADIINIGELFFDVHLGLLSSITLLLTTQTLGFSFAGLVHDLLVKPVAMIFPSTLVTTTMFTTLHDQTSIDMRPRLRFFTMAFIGIFAYQFLPNLFAPTLSSMALLCFLNPGNSAFKTLSSGYKGFGLPNISLDWNAIGTSGPLYQPWWAALNFYGGLAAAMYVVMPMLYAMDFWDAQSFPSPIDAGMYEQSHAKFNVKSVLTPEHSLDQAQWAERKPLLLTPWFAISYGCSFAVLTSMITHVFLWHRKDIYKALRYPNHEDVHNRLMKAYHPVPKRWYMITFIVSLSSAVILVATTPLQLPVWGLLLAVGIALLFLIPVGVIKAVSDTGIGLNVITEFVAGLLLPGKPIANVCFKCYGYMAMAQALDLTTDLKLAHYMKIPPKSMFLAQVWGTVIGCVVNLAVVRLVLSPAAGYRPFLDGSEVDPTGQWDGRKVNIFYSASIIWGAIGPVEFFSGKYRVLFWGFAIGALAPLVPWMLNRRWPRRYWHLINFPVLIHGAASPPQTPNNIIISGFAAAWTSQWWARKKHPRWFGKRNYVLAAALDAGSSVNALCIFVLSITVLKILPVPHWWMNPEKDSEHCTP